LISGVVSVLFVAVIPWGIAGIVLGLLLGKIVGAALMGWVLRDEIELCLERRTLRVMADYCVPLIPGWWVAFGSAYLSRFFIYGVQGADQNAILAVVTKVTSVIGFYSVSFRSAWEPLAMSYIGDAKGEAFYVASMRVFTAGLMLSILCMAAVLQPLLAFLAPASYAPVAYYFPLFAVATVIAECGSSLMLGNEIAKTTHWISISSVLSVVVNVAILAKFTGQWGIFAAGIGLGMSALVKTVIIYVTAQRSCRIDYDTRSLGLMTAGCVALLTLGFGIPAGALSPWVFAAVSATLGVAIAWYMLSAVERQQFRSFVSGRAGKLSSAA
jgi:O-antigen/teichoic acid export membrane protein